MQLVPFPALSNANKDGLLAMGGDLNLNTLVSAYSQGIFPWFNPGQPVLWWSPDPRLVLFPQRMKVRRSLRKVLSSGRYTLTMNRDFARVIDACAWRGQEPDAGEPANTWISNAMQAAYNELFAHGYAHSIEVWRDGNLAGGLYGLVLGEVFFGESMFSSQRDASKVALWGLCHWLQEKQVRLIDCQVTNDHLLSIGAEEIPRSEFIEYLESIDISAPQRDFGRGFEQCISAGLKRQFAKSPNPAIREP